MLVIGPLDVGYAGREMTAAVIGIWVITLGIVITFRWSVRARPGHPETLKRLSDGGGDGILELP